MMSSLSIVALPFGLSIVTLVVSTMILMLGDCNDDNIIKRLKKVVIASIKKRIVYYCVLRRSTDMGLYFSSVTSNGKASHFSSSAF